MHELAVTKSIIGLLRDYCLQHKIARLHEAVLVVGALTTYASDSLQFYYGLLAKEDALLQGSRLTVKRVEPLIHCSACGKDESIDDPLMFFCPSCSSSDVTVLSGREFMIKEIRGELRV